VTVIGDEKHCFYYRPMTPLVVKGDKERDEILQKDQPLHCAVIHDRVVSLAAGERLVTTSRSGKIAFDRLLIATGSSPVIPDITGISEKNVYYLRTIDDAMALKEASRNAKSAVVIGAGLVGIKKAVALSGRGLKVTVVERLDHILLPRLDREGAEIMAARLTERGITLITGVEVKGIMPGGKGVELTDGRKFAADMVCVAVGVKPNIDWLIGSGVAMDRAIVVDERMQTSVAGVYAAGDVVQTSDCVTGRTVVSGLWTNAVDMGRVAGANMAGSRIKYPGSLEVLNATEIEKLAMVSVGAIMPESGGYEVVSRRNRDGYRKSVFKDDVLVGVIMLGDINRAGVYVNLIRGGFPLGLLKEKVSAGTMTYLDFAALGH
jgi:NAD(P)H-nitrite reductase large subunit